MTLKSKSGIFTRVALCLSTDTFPNEEEKLLNLGRYLFSVAYGNIYLSRGSKENVLSITIAGNLSVTR